MNAWSANDRMSTDKNRHRICSERRSFNQYFEVGNEYSITGTDVILVLRGEMWSLLEEGRRTVIERARVREGREEMTNI